MKRLWFTAILLMFISACSGHISISNKKNRTEISPGDKTACNQLYEVANSFEAGTDSVFKIFGQFAVMESIAQDPQLKQAFKDINTLMNEGLSNGGDVGADRTSEAGARAAKRCSDLGWRKPN